MKVTIERVVESQATHLKANTLAISGNGSIILLTKDWNFCNDGQYYTGLILKSDFNPSVEGQIGTWFTASGIKAFKGRVTLENSK